MQVFFCGTNTNISRISRVFQACVSSDLISQVNARPRVWPAVRELLVQYRPDLLELYRRVLFEPAFREPYVAELHRRVRQAAAEAGIGDRL